MEKFDYAKMIKVLQLAKPLIKNQLEIFVCGALGYVGDRHPSLRKASHDLRNWIAKSIDGHVTVRGWLAERGLFDELPKDVNSNGSEELRLYRMMWIDQMISLLKGGK